MESNIIDIKRNRDALERYIHFFNHLETELDQSGEYLHDDISFQDPFNCVEGLAALNRVLRNFVKSVKEPRFDVTHRAWDGNVCFIRWNFSGHLSLFGEWRFPGVSELHFSAQGKVLKHVDHWDAGEHFYQRLPILGRVVQMIRRRI